MKLNIKKKNNKITAHLETTGTPLGILNENCYKSREKKIHKETMTFFKNIFFPTLFLNYFSK